MFPIHRLKCQIHLDSYIRKAPLETISQTNFHFLRIFCEHSTMKVTVALLALTVLFALAASQRRRRHSYDIEEGIPSWNFGPITLTPEPNKRDDSDAGLKMPGLFDLGGHTSWKGMLT